MLKRRVVNTDAEEKLLTNMIVSDKVCRDVHKMIRRDSFLNSYGQTVSRWITSYYKQYRKAPKNQIQDIYNVERDKIKEEELPMIQSFLQKISDQYAKGDEPINEDFAIDRGREYLKARALKNIAERIESFLEMGKVDDVERH